VIPAAAAFWIFAVCARYLCRHRRAFGVVAHESLLSIKQAEKSLPKTVAQ